MIQKVINWVKNLFKPSFQDLVTDSLYIDPSYFNRMQRYNDDFYLEQLELAKQYTTETRTLPIIGANNGKKTKQKRRQRIQTRRRKQTPKIVKSKSTKATKKIK